MEKKENVLSTYLKRYFIWIALSVVMAIGHNYLNLLLPLMLRDLVDNVILKEQWGKISDMAVLLVGIFVGAGIFSLFRTLSAQYIGQNVVYEMRADMYRALQRQSYSFYDKERTGNLMSKATSDVARVQHFLSIDFGNFLRDVFTLAIILYTVFSINALLSIIFLALIPALLGLMVWYRKRMFKIYLDMSNTNGDLNSVLQENVTGVRVVKAFGREKHEIKKYFDINKKFLISNEKVIKLSTLYGPLQELITQVGSVLLLFIGGVFVLTGFMTLGEVVSFFVYFAFLYDPIRNMVTIYSQFSQVSAALVRINSILEHKVDITEKPNAVSLQVQGHVEFKDVWFSYEENGPWALQGIDFDVKPGETIALLGATGSGKTTIINLIPRFYDPTKGVIKVDGYDLRDLKIDDYRRQIGMVAQETFLFSRTIKENIAYGKPNAKMEDIIKVAKIASIHNFIASLPDGYNTKVGERGQTLSGGQKQRIAIARALFLDPRILILDDSLSAVDVDTEYEIQKALDTLFKGRTTFIITQRISTIRNADRIFVLDDGKIIESGTHAELFSLDGIYTKIYQTMFKTQSKDFITRYSFSMSGISVKKEPLEKTASKAGLLNSELLEEDKKVLDALLKEKYPDIGQRQRMIAKIQKRKASYDEKELAESYKLLTEEIKQEIARLQNELKVLPQNVIAQSKSEIEQKIEELQNKLDLEEEEYKQRRTEIKLMTKEKLETIKEEFKEIKEKEKEERDSIRDTKKQIQKVIKEESKLEKLKEKEEREAEKLKLKEESKLEKLKEKEEKEAEKQKPKKQADSDKYTIKEQKQKTKNKNKEEEDE
jgi:ABC-type multidrug transport system fused ATPase/permease subunit